MYRKYYGLARNPFDISPDRHFFYPTPRHNEALANLNYGVQRRRGFIVVTGEVGTGKTLLARCLLDMLASNRISFAFVFNPILSVEDFLYYVIMDLRLPIQGKRKSEILVLLNNYLISRHRLGSTVALIVDEAHLLSFELLEEIRLLTNLETSQQKLLQIILLGQPELDCKLDSPRLRQLKQRVSLRCRLEPLSAQELRGYLFSRLKMAGASSRGETLFSDEAIAAIHQYSGGIPRLINTICENALISGYARNASTITPDIIGEVAADFRFDLPPRSNNGEQDETKDKSADAHKTFLRDRLRLIFPPEANPQKQLAESDHEQGAKAQ